MPDAFVSTYPIPDERSCGLRCASAAFDMIPLYVVGDDKVSPRCDNHDINVKVKDHALTNHDDSRVWSIYSTIMFNYRYPE
ncbi:unnamed protein product [Clonostachys byssicola]|uniref:Uncharacterized protein n=1 Tax=Clonostachys byssicola TaxID=160290 RepID=A0A9N9UK32_9HYPO|nr:unnamed protein product [Clonostachys byssicola]